MPASLITFAHSGVSFLMIAVNSAGVLPTGSRPSSSNFLRTAGIASVLTVSSCNLSRMYFAVAAGVSRANHGRDWEPGKPDSAMDGKYGASGDSFRAVMAHGREF